LIEVPRSSFARETVNAFSAVFEEL